MADSSLQVRPVQRAAHARSGSCVRLSDTPSAFFGDCRGCAVASGPVRVARQGSAPCVRGGRRALGLLVVFPVLPNREHPVGQPSCPDSSHYMHLLMPEVEYRPAQICWGAWLLTQHPGHVPGAVARWSPGRVEGDLGSGVPMSADAAPETSVRQPSTCRCRCVWCRSSRLGCPTCKLRWRS